MAKLLAPSSRDRPPSAEAVRTDLVRLRAGLPVEPSPPAPEGGDDAEPQAPGLPLPWIGVATAAALALALALVLVD